MLLERVLAETESPASGSPPCSPRIGAATSTGCGNRTGCAGHLHFSLQSGSDAVLRRMRRRYNGDRYRRVAEEARRALPGVALTTDVIAGFPGETDAGSPETESFLRSIGFAGLHVFKYSPRSGTPAAKMDGQVSPGVKQERSDRLIALAGEMSEEYRRRFLGTTLEVLWEEEISRERGWASRGGGGRLSQLRKGVRRRRSPGRLEAAPWPERLAGDGVVGTLTRWG